MKKEKILPVIISLLFISLHTHAQDFILLKDSTSTPEVSLEEISVKAPKERSLLKSLPASVSVVSNKLIENNEVHSLKDLSSLVPNFFMPDYGSKLTSPVYIRGIGSKINSPSVGLYVDGVPYFEKAAFDFEFFDIERIEVLRGPQGTLYGRNTMGGIINVFTKSPLQGNPSTLRISAGNYGYMNASLNHYSKIGMNTGMAVNLNYSHSNGYFTNTFNDEQADNYDAAGARLKFLHKFSDKLTIENIASIEYSDQNGYPYAIYNDSLKSLSDVNYNHVSGYKRNMFSDALIARYENKNFEVTSTTAYQMLDDQQEIDQDFTPQSLYFVDQEQYQHTLSQEITIKSNNNSQYQWITGAYGFYQYLDKSVYVDVFTKGMQLQKFYDNRISGQAIFHQSSLKFEDLTLTAGFRVDHEKNVLDYQYFISMNENLSTNTDTLYSPLKFFKFSPKLAMSYKLGSSNLYANVTQGYKTGGYNSTVERPEDLTFDPETSTSYEAGIKTSLLNRMVYGEMALFYIDWYNQQIYQTVPSGRGAMLKNAGHSASKGIELSMKTISFRGFEFNASYGYTNAKFISYVKDTATNYNGNYIPFIPKHTFSFFIIKSIPVNAPVLDLVRLNLLYKGVGKHYWDEENSAYEDFYGLMNAKVTFVRKNLEFDLWARNLLNADYSAFYFESFGNQYFQRGKPLQIGANLNIKF